MSVMYKYIDKVYTSPTLLMVMKNLAKSKQILTKRGFTSGYIDNFVRYLQELLSP